MNQVSVGFPSTLLQTKCNVETRHRKPGSNVHMKTDTAFTIGLHVTSSKPQDKQPQHSSHDMKTFMYDSLLLVDLHPSFLQCLTFLNKSTNAKGHKQYISIHPRPRGNSPWWVFTALHICPLPTSKGKTWGISSSTACKAFSADAWEDVAPAKTKTEMPSFCSRGGSLKNMVDWRLLSNKLFNIVSMYIYIFPIVMMACPNQIDINCHKDPMGHLRLWLVAPRWTSGSCSCIWATANKSSWGHEAMIKVYLCVEGLLIGFKVFCDMNWFCMFLVCTWLFGFLFRHVMIHQAVLPGPLQVFHHPLP